MISEAEKLRNSVKIYNEFALVIMFVYTIVVSTTVNIQTLKENGIYLAPAIIGTIYTSMNFLELFGSKSMPDN
jgi:hypothetical protein